MRIVTVGGTNGKKALAEYLAREIDGAHLVCLPGGCESAGEAGGAAADWTEVVEPDSVLVVEGNTIFPDERPLLAIFYAETPMELLGTAEREASRQAEIFLIDWNPRFEGESELLLERSIKSETAARKVLISSDDESRNRAFGKVLDIVISRLGREWMPEEIPEDVMEAVEREADEGKMPCARACEIARELGVPIPLVGRALDLLGIKITRCQLGCF